MKNIFSALFISFSFVSFIILPLQAEGTNPPPKTLVIYTYDSLIAKEGFGARIFPLFEKKFHCKIKALASGDAGQILTRIKTDAQRGGESADIALGIDQNLWPAIENYSDKEKWQPKNYNQLVEVTKIESGFVPFDYGVFAFMADTKNLKSEELPKHYQDLLNPKLKRKILLEDPRTSTPGLGFIMGASEALGEKGALAFFSSFSGQWLTLTPGWSEAYGLFLKGEAPLVWSYTTSEAYHRAHGDKEGRYRALEFSEGHPVQIEGAVLLKKQNRSEEQTKQAREFLNFLISKEAQDLVAETNWMLPALKDVPLPESFREIPKPKKLFRSSLSESQLKNLLKAWEISSLGKGTPKK
jgi:thiamine transport system substrate-binding protein